LQGGLVVLRLRQVEQLAVVAQPLADAQQRADNRLERLALLAQLLRALVVSPQRRIFGELGDFGQAIALGIEFKDTSAVPQSAARGRLWHWLRRLRVRLPFGIP
jgi:hypothetical protein